MSDGLSWEMKGLDELQAALEELPEKLARKVTKAALADGAEIIKNEMVDNAPKKSGFLSKHFGTHVSVKSDAIAGKAVAGPLAKTYYPNAGDRKLGVSTGKHPVKGGAVPVASVARFLEFGTRKMKAEPFMRNAVLSRAQAALDKMIQHLRDGLVSITRR